MADRSRWQTRVRSGVGEARYRERVPGPNFPLDNGDAFINLANGEPPRGRFSARFPLSVYITFAYKFRPSPDQRRAMLAPLPKWVWSDMYDIEARAPKSDATKDQMRLMMQSLLAKPGKLGPNLRPHESGPPCDSSSGNRPPDKDLFPPDCDTYMLRMQQNGTRRLGSRHTTMDLLGSSIPTVGELTRPVVDHTGLSGRFDFTLEWMRETNSAAPAAPLSNDPQTGGPTFLEALNDQLGLKLEAGKAPVPMLVIDHVERPSAN